MLTQRRPLFGLLILLLLCFFSNNEANAHVLDSYDGNAAKVPFKDDDVLQIYQKWVDTGLSSLMAAFANKK
jgi:hypothetical protein